MKRRKLLQIEAFVNRREYLTDKPGNSSPAVSTMKIPWNRKGYPAQGQQQNYRSEQDKRATIMMIAARLL